MIAATRLLSVKRVVVLENRVIVVQENEEKAGRGQQPRIGLGSRSAPRYGEARAEAPLPNLGNHE